MKAKRTSKLQSEQSTPPASAARNPAHDLATFEALWRRDRQARRLAQRIAVLQSCLHDALSDHAWHLYLALEEAVNHRQDHLLEKARVFWSREHAKQGERMRPPSKGFSEAPSPEDSSRTS